MDDLEKTMRFIVEQQAQFTVDIQRIKEVQAEFSKEFAADMQQVREVLSSHSGAIVSLLDIVGKLGEAQAATDARLSRVETSLVDLAQAGKETESRLNAFIAIVEKYLSSRDGEK